MKQDRQGVRKASDIEQKYKLNNDFTEIEKLATEALRTANLANARANNAASDANKATHDVANMTEAVSDLEERVGTLEETGGGGTSGGMSASVYDPQGKQQDIFAYVDDAIRGAIEGSY